MRRTVLVTGGTGTLGRELVHRVVREPDVARVVVISRAPSAAARHALPAAWAQAGPAEVRLVRGDVRDSALLGLAPADAAALRDVVTDVLHCAADTTFTLPLAEARAVNVDGTRHVLGFAAGCPSLRRVGLLSTVYVAGRRTGTFGEDDVGAGESGYVNSYERSKAEMEEAARVAMRTLPVVLYRLSTVVGDSRTGTVHTFNSVHHALRLFYQGLAPMVPGDGATRVDLIPTDYAAAVAQWLFFRAFEPGRTYHICAGPARSATLDALLDVAIHAFHCYRPAWRKRSIARPALVDLETYELFVRSVEEAGNEVLRQATRTVQAFAYQLAFPKAFDARRAETALAGSGLAAPDVLDFYPKVVRHCVETNWGAVA
jgi:nucleoside-diphosphate-sugar epimerase